MAKQTEGNILLADEISPDTCRLWDVKRNEKFDKDVFRRDLGNLTDAYEKILARIRRTFNMYKVKGICNVKRKCIRSTRNSSEWSHFTSMNYNEVQMFVSENIWN